MVIETKKGSSNSVQALPVNVHSRRLSLGDGGIIDPLHIRKRETRLGAVSAAIYVSRPGCGTWRQSETPDIAEPVSFQEKLAATLLYEFRDNGRLVYSRRIERWLGVGCAKRVDDGYRAGKVAGVGEILRDDKLRLRILRKRLCRRRCCILVGEHDQSLAVGAEFSRRRKRNSRIIRRGIKLSLI